jgi:uncharacterized repeat protein (TIGR01451 family)
LEKRTNGEDADFVPGPAVLVGSPVLWTYVVTNTGDVDLTAVTITDDKGVAVICPKTTLQPGESMTCTGQGTALGGPYANTGTASGQPPEGPAVTASDPSHYIGLVAGIDLEKRTNGQDADTAPGPDILVGSTVQWTYVVTNIGDTALTSLQVTDDKGVAVSCPKTTLQPGESMTCSASGTATAGQYANVGTVSGQALGIAFTSTDPSHYRARSSDPGG